MSQRRRVRNIHDQFQCPRCKEWKYSDEYYANKLTLDGISSYCKECHKEKMKYYAPSAKEARRREREEAAHLDLQHQMLELLLDPKPLGPPD